ncbi:S-methyl-5'-thioadenosine phosphorylase [Microplitis mediator]|uniref:S-methyl-5'-thioadenosine phosphorylase n=1 Tax=Microplitis mediator TaxID=375433 RepID=UPI0025524A2D|nr:S-methyl-5'-thioadenosine phosphorylase [Microplitis mediator]
MGKYKIKVGIIGGSGLGDIADNILKNSNQLNQNDLKNDFGLPSGNIYTGIINGVEVALLSRHGHGHKINPTNVNYRANIEALKLIGCTHILASNACGSLCDEIGRGQLVIPDSYIDRTYARKNTLFDGISPRYQGVCHVPMEPSFHPDLAEVFELAAKELSIDVRRGGTIVTIEGPRFSSKAESNAFRMWGGQLVGMTSCPEVSIAKEAGIIYGAIAMSTDYDCWKESDNVCAGDVIKVFLKNVKKITDLLVKAVEIIGQRQWDQQIDNLKDLIESGNVSAKN